MSLKSDPVFHVFRRCAVLNHGGEDCVPGLPCRKLCCSPWTHRRGFNYSNGYARNDGTGCLHYKYSFDNVGFFPGQRSLTLELSNEECRVGK